MTESIKSIEQRAAETIQKELKIVNEKLKHKKDEAKMTYSEITKLNNEEFRSILRDENEKQKKEEKNRESRSCNVIIHGTLKCQHGVVSSLKRLTKEKYLC